MAAVILVIGAFLGISVLKLGGSADPAPVIINTAVPTATFAPTATAQPIQVFVNGEVAVPDVYVLPPGSRVKQAVEAAGGFTKKANSAVVNLAQPLVDGVHIYVPEIIESTEVPQQVITTPPVRSHGGVGRLLININTADMEELDKLPGVGPAIAQKIIDYRTANGSFATIEAILEVSGIGEAKFQQIRDLITIGN